MFKDENVEIRDETQEGGEEKEGDGEEEGCGLSERLKVSVEPSDPVDDLQLAWEHLELSRKIFNQQLEDVQNSEADDKKEKGIQIIKQVIEISLRLGDLESWRDNLAEAVNEYARYD